MHKEPVLGQIPTTKISGGVRTLILILKEDDKDFSAIIKNTGEKVTDIIRYIDEENRFMPSTDFESATKCPDNYYILITREPLTKISYSPEDVYKLKVTSAKPTHIELESIH